MDWMKPPNRRKCADLTAVFYFAKCIFCVDVLYPFVQMFIFTGRGAVGSADIHIAKGIFCVNVLYLLSK
ncbi:MAG: hypothetical protein IKI45_01330 [Oscillospiraceae bacterium]|nr:hypothetical protein [Oscillospiraceae bacterium]